MSNSLRPHGLQHARLPCPSLSPEGCSNSSPLSQWCNLPILSSVATFSSASTLSQLAKYVTPNQGDRKKTEQNYNKNMHSMQLQVFWPKIKVKASLVFKKKKKNFQILRFSGMSPFDISPSLGETSSGEWIWDSKVMSGWTLIVSRSLFQHWIPGENEEAEKHQSTTEGQNELHLTETPTYWGGALGKFFSKKGKACFWNC